MLHRVISSLILAGVLVAPAVGAPFEPLEATIAATQSAIAAGSVTCHAVVAGYLGRIEANDKQGASLNTVISLNPRALATADTLDAMPKSERAGKRLFCVPIVLKDNYDTADLPTSGGTIALAGSIPARDAFTVARLRASGAVILAKTNLHELALSGTSVSSLGGQTHNPYDLTRTPGGSSGGTGAALAANFALAGTGSDTVNSVRSPASANSLVGMRPTRGLVSRAGILPVSSTQDAAGPLARTVADVAAMLDVMAGADPADPVTSESAGHIAASYLAAARPSSMRGLRIGVLTNFFGTGAPHAETNRVMETALAAMQRAGATLVRLDVAGIDTDTLNKTLDVQVYEYRSVLDPYLAARGGAPAIKNLHDLVALGLYDKTIADFLKRADAMQDGTHQPDYLDRLAKARALRESVLAAMDRERVVALVYPEQKRLVVPIGEGQSDRNGILAAMTGLPSLAMPAGFSTPTPSAPLGVPVGMELFGRPWSEASLLSLAASYEALMHTRVSPRATP